MTDLIHQTFQKGDRVRFVTHPHLSAGAIVAVYEGTQYPFEVEWDGSPYHGPLNYSASQLVKVD